MNNIEKKGWMLIGLMLYLHHIKTTNFLKYIFIVNVFKDNTTCLNEMFDKWLQNRNILSETEDRTTHQMNELRNWARNFS